MTSMYLYDDELARGFEPFALTRPVSELRAGVEIIRRRWEIASESEAAGFFSAGHLGDFDEAGAPASAANVRSLPAGTLVVNSRFVVALDAVLHSAQARFENGGRTCAARIDRAVETGQLLDGTLSLDELARGAPAAEVSGRWLTAAWDLVGSLDSQLSADIPVMASSLSAGPAQSATVIGSHDVFCEAGANIEPFVLLDASHGPILIRTGATLSSFTRIVGPCYIGQNTKIVGDAIRGCSIGDVCKVRGEISSSIMLGHSNKGHTGFVGSSYLGRWVNLGAGTTTSNLKNTYGKVQVLTAGGMRDTSLQFLGSLVGDHVKTGIGTMLNTGCTVGAGANIYGTGITPKSIPPFAWGASEPYGRFDRSKLAMAAERMMARRHVTLTEKARRQLENSFDASEPER